jgi:hypothetical protein
MLRDAIAEANEMMNHLEQAYLFGYVSDEKAHELIRRYDNLAGNVNSEKTI